MKKDTREGALVSKVLKTIVKSYYLFSDNQWYIFLLKFTVQIYI